MNFFKEGGGSSEAWSGGEAGEGRGARATNTAVLERAVHWENTTGAFHTHSFHVGVITQVWAETHLRYCIKTHVFCTLNYSENSPKRTIKVPLTVITAAAAAAGLITWMRWCATAECYGLHCLFKSMLGGLCSFTKEGWLGSKASEAKAAKKVLKTQLSLWPEGIPADNTLCTRDPSLLQLRRV